jgi:hypothetical protein
MFPNRQRDPDARPDLIIEHVAAFFPAAFARRSRIAA